MTVLVFGSTGQVARELQALAPGATFLGRAAVDLVDCAAVTNAIRTLKPSAVINAAAYTAVDRAESEEDLAFAVNAKAPDAMATACADLGIPLVHISTDYVFEGTGTQPHRPDDRTGPVGAYGRTKLAGESAVRASGCTHAILRTSWVFSSHGANFMKTMLRLSETRDKLTVVADQVGGPTSARSIAVACLTIANQLQADPAKSGTYHFSGQPDITWADFARAIFESSGRATVVEDIPTSAYPTPARRPANSRMDCSSTRAVFGIDRPDWLADLRTVLTQLETLS